MAKKELQELEERKARVARQRPKKERRVSTHEERVYNARGAGSRQTIEPANVVAFERDKVETQGKYKVIASYKYEIGNRVQKGISYIQHRLNSDR